MQLGEQEQNRLFNKKNIAYQLWKKHLKQIQVLVSDGSFMLSPWIILVSFIKQY